MSNLSFGCRVSVDCPKCGYQFYLSLDQLNASGENKHYCEICKKHFSFGIMFFGQGVDEKQMENKP